jgi:hypothetical protein
MVNQGPRGRDADAAGANGDSGRISTRTSDSASADARRKLEALFSGGARTVERTPTFNTEKVFSSPRRSLGRTPSEYRLRLERLRVAREVADIQEAADAFLAHHQLPDDPDILFKLLLHPSEKVNREAIGQISALLMQSRLTATVVLADRLNTLANRATEKSTHNYIEGLRAQIAKLAKP